MNCAHAGVLAHPPKITMENARKEAEAVLFDSVRDVLREANLHPRNVRTHFFAAQSLTRFTTHHLKDSSAEVGQWVRTIMVVSGQSDTASHAFWHSFVPARGWVHYWNGRKRMAAADQREDGLQVDIVIVNCSLFNPTPSLSAMIVHHFKMRPNIITYNLSGMGCSAGIISIGLAKELLQVTTQLLLRAQLPSGSLDP